MPSNNSQQVRLHPAISDIVARYAEIDDKLIEFYECLFGFLVTGKAKGIFPRQLSQIDTFLSGLPDLKKQINEEPQVVAVTGRRALVALNSFIFGGRAVLADEAFFCDRTLFMIGGGAPANQIMVRVQVYSKGKMSQHGSKQLDSIEALNYYMTSELLKLDQECDAVLVDIAVYCPELARVKIAAAPRMDSAIKELLEPIQQKPGQPQHHLRLLLHYFSPHSGSGSETERRSAESELNYVCSMATRSQLLLVCEHRIGRRDDVAASVQKYEGPSVKVCYFTQWQWDGLSAVKPELESLLDSQLHKRCTQLAKRAIKEIGLPFKVTHQILRTINLSRSVANRQKRPEKEYLKDFRALKDLAGQLGSKFESVAESKISEVSNLVAQHLRNGNVRASIIRAILNRAPELKGGTDHKVEISFLEVVSSEIREWNRTSPVLIAADELVHRTKMDYFKQLCSTAESIPEIILVANDMLNSTETSAPNSPISPDSESKATIHSFIDDMVRRRLRAGRLENFAAGIAAPLWVPLAAITMAIIAPVIGAQKGQQSDEKFLAELRGMAQDFLDRLDSALIRNQFFARVRERLHDDAKRLKDFIECYCILPGDYDLPVNIRMNDADLVQHLVDLDAQLQYLHSNLMMLQVKKLGCDVLNMEKCQALGIDMYADDLGKLGTAVAQGKTVYLVEPPNSAQKPLVLKVAAKGEDSHRLLLEIDILKALSAERHGNLIAWIGTVYFPRLNTIGFLTNKYDCDLWQFLQRFGPNAVPGKNALGSAERSDAFVVCRNTCEQIFAGVGRLHSKQILHRDLKPENVLVEIQQDTKPLRMVAKLCDFGMAKHESEMSGRTTGGTNGYMAPEILTNKPVFSNKSDIYALGIIAWECFFGRRIREEPPGTLRTVKTEDNKPWDFLVDTMTFQQPSERPLIEQCQVGLRELNKKPDAVNSLDPKQIMGVPSYNASLKVLNNLNKGGQSK